MGVAQLREVPALRPARVRSAGDLPGADVSSDKLRQCARCTACGHKGATISAGWGGERIGFLPFPAARENTTPQNF